jgi:peptidylprolyl isomerase
MSTKPEVTIPAGDAPSELLIEDITVGTGAEAKAGANVEVHYVGVAWSTQSEFDASWNREKPLNFAWAPDKLFQGGIKALLV